MFGTSLSVPIPDIDRTDYILILGANPMESNGSLMTAPDMPGRLKAVRERGGKVVVIDPRRTRTAAQADAHHFIRPGTDASLLAAIVHTIFADGLVRLGRLEQHTVGVERVRELVAPFSPEAPRSTVPSRRDDSRARPRSGARRAPRRLRSDRHLHAGVRNARELARRRRQRPAGQPRPPGGAMFTKPATGASNTRGMSGRGKGVRFGRRHTRVRNAPEVYGEYPAACLAEEIDTPGDGRVRALVTVAGNPVLSTPTAVASPRRSARSTSW